MDFSWLYLTGDRLVVLITWVITSYTFCMLDLLNDMEYMYDNLEWIEQSTWWFFDYLDLTDFSSFNDKKSLPELKEIIQMYRYGHIFKETEDYVVSGRLLGIMLENCMGNSFNDHSLWMLYTLWEYSIVDLDTNHVWTGLAILPLSDILEPCTEDSNLNPLWAPYIDWPRFLYLNPRDGQIDLLKCYMSHWLNFDPVQPRSYGTLIHIMSNYDSTFQFMKLNVKNLPDYLISL